MMVLLLPLSDTTLQLLGVYDNLICIIFLIDFFLNLRGASRKSDYFIGQRGWLDLLGSIPSFGVLKLGGLLRLARLSRLARITRLLRGEQKKALVKDVLDHRSQYAVFITLFSTILVLTVASVLVLQFESQSPDANITTGGDSLWYSIVTITTVGYGDFYPVTRLGRITAMFIMIAGVGIIGALASIMASLLVGSATSPEEEAATAAAPALSIQEELRAVKEELAVMRQLLEKMGAG
jgi:voltage-gated potassium channel